MGSISLIKGDITKPRKNYWVEFKKQIKNLIIEALLILRQRSDLIIDESNLNRVLHDCFVEANAKLGLNYIPAYEAKNPPHYRDKRKAKRENNIPDLSWCIIDHNASYRDWNRNFALECKRLGIKTEAGFVFNEQYVIEGILRFSLEEKGYAKGCETSAMAGYIQNMEFDEILQQINLYLSIREPSIPPISLSTDGWQKQGVSYLSHTFDRSYEPAKFLLQHFWVDMKDCAFIEAPPKRKEKTLSTQQEQLPKKRKKQSSNISASQPEKNKTDLVQVSLLELPITDSH